MATRSLDPGERRSGETLLRQIMPGARLEGVTFRIAELTLCFLHARADEAKGLPAHVWLTAVCDAGVFDDPAASRRAERRRRPPKGSPTASSGAGQESSAPPLGHAFA